ncbi:hypothetical protein QEH59_17340 [Coraliomargarita sp. SDUM461004]|uniref:Uncharacterized protein n=1 Tax=Thalassobacterium sedimentorum TaxID=3041258 RepID=A0ABU1AN28_9BACT|nr:hypothetical protein [Coraliomargarita sp. SDUM461004]MDQ8196202.1 hypothetical protein [Coraliomargarita sp. SDUM461004]
MSLPLWYVIGLVFGEVRNDFVSWMLFIEMPILTKQASCGDGNVEHRTSNIEGPMMNVIESGEGRDQASRGGDAWMTLVAEGLILGGRHKEAVSKRFEQVVNGPDSSLPIVLLPSKNDTSVIMIS